MDPDEIAKLCQALSLSEEEGEICKIDRVDQEKALEDVAHCLVGKILANKRVNREAFKGVIRQLWGAIGNVEVEAIGENLFMFYFNRKEDRNLVWNRGPWHFDHNLIVLEKPSGIGDVSKLGFNNVEIWVQIHNIPLLCMNRQVAKLLASQIGSVVEIPAESKDCRGKFLRVKVQINITKPLKRCLKLSLDDSGEVSVALLKYERLPDFCYACGRLGHGSRDCTDEEAKANVLLGSEAKYGSWLRARPVEGIRRKPSRFGPSTSSGGMQPSKDFASRTEEDSRSRDTSHGKGRVSRATNALNKSVAVSGPLGLDESSVKCRSQLMFKV